MPDDSDFDKDSEPSTLWRMSAFDRLRETAWADPPGLGGRVTQLSTTLRGELRTLESRRDQTDVLEVVAACVRTRSPALVYLRYDDIVWPVTLFPAEGLYHSPRNLLSAPERTLQALSVVTIEPPAVRPPGHWMYERVAQPESYHPLMPTLWQLALHGGRSRLLAEIGGTAAYRVLRDPAAEDLATPGALGPAVARLRREAAALHHIMAWPGMSGDRATAMLNALYVTSNLMVTRIHPRARADSTRGLLRRWLG